MKTQVTIEKGYQTGEEEEETEEVNGVESDGNSPKSSLGIEGLTARETSGTEEVQARTLPSSRVADDGGARRSRTLQVVAGGMYLKVSSSLQPILCPMKGGGRTAVKGLKEIRQDKLSVGQYRGIQDDPVAPPD